MPIKSAHWTYTLDSDGAVDDSSIDLIAPSGGAANILRSSYLGSIAITGGTINGTTVGATTPAAGSFTTLGATGDVTFDTGNLSLDATTFANQKGIITKNGTPFVHNFNYGNNGTVTTEGFNTFVGEGAGNLTMGSTATQTYHASYNTFCGFQAGYNSTTGYRNNFNGYRAGYNVTEGSTNSFFGHNTGGGITTGTGNTILGADITGLAAGLTNNIILASGSTARATFDGTKWSFPLEVYLGGSGLNGIKISSGGGLGIIAALDTGGLSFRSSDNTTRLTIDSSGDVICTSGALFGYGTGAGGAVTQGTSRTTGVTLNKPCGAITLVSAAGTATWQTFTVTNSVVAATDTIIVNQQSGTDLNMIHITAVAAGSFNVSFATTGGTTTEQPVFNFAVIKAAAA